MKLSVSLFGGCLAALMVAQDVASEVDPRRESYREWWVYSGDSAGTKYSELDQINRSNVSQLEVAWIFHSGDPRGRFGSSMECNPIVVRGWMYVTSPALRLFALDARNGRTRWVFDPWHGRRASGVNRGVTYWEQGKDRRIFYSAGNQLYALGALTGRLIEGFGSSGSIDLREGLDQDLFFLSAASTSPAMIYKDLLIVGTSVGEGPSPAAPGHVRAYDVRTGARRWIFHTIPHPGEFGYDTWPPEAWKTTGGANAWGGFSLDAKRGTVFFGTGSPAYDHWGGNRAGQNLFGNCVMALDAATGKRLWHFQAVHHDLWDYDLPCPPNLVTVNRDGKRIEAVAQPTKLGHLLVLNRETGEPVFPVEERLVPKSEIPGEVSWPTQPFPPESLRYAQQRMSAELVTRRVPKTRESVLARLKKMRMGSVFLPPGLQPSVALPQFNGGTDWGGAAYDPETHLLYVNASNEAEWISMIRSKPKTEATLNEFGKHLYRAICSNCHGIGDPLNPASPSLATLKQVQRRLSERQVLDLLETGRGQMPSFATFSNIEKRAVVAFLFGKGDQKRLKTGELNLSWANEIPYVATGHHPLRGPEGFPVNRRPWGTLNAIDLNQGKRVWQVPLGTYPGLESQGVPPTGTFNMGGPVVTRGGLVFIGAAMDERFHCYDKETGKLLWQYQMKAGGYATPATYEIKGRQYVVIAAGGGPKPGTRSGDAYYCFALPGAKE